MNASSRHASPSQTSDALLAVLVVALLLEVVPGTRTPASESAALQSHAGAPAPALEAVAAARAGEPHASEGYWLVVADGAVHAFGSADVFGANRNFGPDIVGMSRTTDGRGYWMVDEDGDVFEYGTAPDLGSRAYNTNDVVDFAAAPGADGYWMVARDGGVFSFGDADFYGSTGAMTLNQPIVGMAATPSGAGYWLAARDGGIFSFGDADFYGSTGAMTLNQPIVGMESTGTGRGYWLVATDGGIFSFGDAPFYGSTGGAPLPQPIIGMVATPPDHRPSTTADRATLDEDSALRLAVLDNDTGLGDVDAETPTPVAVVEGPGHGTTAVDAAGAIVYTPAPDYHGADAFVYRVLDRDGDEATAIVEVAVNPLNDAPVVPDWRVATSEGTALSGAIGATDVDGDTLTYTLTALPAHGAVTLDGAGTYTYTPIAHYDGPDSFTVAIDDGNGGTVSATVNVTVSAVDDRPVATPDTATTAEDTAVTIDVAANDAGLSDGGAVVAVDAATLDPAAEGTATVTGGRIVFTPAADVAGTLTFDYSITDVDGDSAAATVTVTITPVNDGPTITGIAPVSVRLGTKATDPIPFTVADVDNPPGTLAVTVTSSNPALVASSGLELTSSSAAGDWTLVITPERNTVGTSTITVTVSDGTLTAQTAFLFEVQPR